MKNETIKNKIDFDKNDFLFEIEDKAYIVTNLLMVLVGLFLLFILLIIHDFNFLDIARGRLGTLVVLLSTPYLIYKI